MSKKIISLHKQFLHTFWDSIDFLLRGIPIGVKREKVRIWNI